MTSQVWFQQIQPGSQFPIEHQFTWGLTRHRIWCGPVVEKEVRHLRQHCTFCELLHLKVWTALSACPLDEGWCGDVRICCIPLFFINCWNSSDTKEGPLSDTSCSGSPREAKHVHSFSIVTCDEDDVVG